MEIVCTPNLLRAFCWNNSSETLLEASLWQSGNLFSEKRVAHSSLTAVRLLMFFHVGPTHRHHTAHNELKMNIDFENQSLVDLLERFESFSCCWVQVYFTFNVCKAEVTFFQLFALVKQTKVMTIWPPCFTVGIRIYIFLSVFTLPWCPT